MKLNKLTLATLIALSTSCVQASDLNISGFINGVVTADSDGHLRLNDDTKAGIQIDTQINDKLSATFQVVNRQNAWDGSDSRETTVEYGFLAYNASEDVTVRAGRLRMPFFMLSEYVEVGNVVPWIKAPLSVYHQIPTNAYDGLDLSYTGQSGDLSYSVTAFVGEAEANVYMEGLNPLVKMGNTFGGSVALDYSDWTMRFSYGQAELSFVLSPLTQMGLDASIADAQQQSSFYSGLADQASAGALQYRDGAAQATAASEMLAGIDDAQSAVYAAQAAEYLALADGYEAQALQAQAGADQYAAGAAQAAFISDGLKVESKVGIYNLGIQGYITDDLSVMGEYVYIDSEHPIENDDQGYYLAATYDFGNDFKFTGTYSHREEKTLGDALNEQTDTYLATVAYDMGDSVIIKAEYSYEEIVIVQNSSSEMVTDENLFSMSVNYVF